MSFLRTVFRNGSVPYGIAYFFSIIVILCLTMGIDRLYPQGITEHRTPSWEYLVSSEFVVRLIFGVLVAMILTFMTIKLALLDKRNGKDWLKVPDELNDWED